MHSERLFWVWLSEQLGVANRDFRRLISLYESPYDLFHAECEELERIEGLAERTVRVLSDKSLVNASAILDRCEQLGISIIPYHDARYPALLRAIKDPPVLLYCRGEMPELDRRLSIGMVGTRRMSAYGLQNAYKISFEMARAGAVVVSGMAAGIDGVSAAAAILAGGTTVAVLGCGVDIAYPKHHKVLMDAICKNGAVISEYAPGTRPSHYHFPIRNRIISGLSQGTLVVEAGIGSGSLITAKTAVLQGRDVFALPANIGSVGAEGTNGLLRDGAFLVTDSSDILERYHYAFADRLDMQAHAKAKTESKADLQSLERYGVIELDRKQRQEAPSTGGVTAALEQAPAAPTRQRPKASTKPIEERPAKACITEPGELRAPSPASTTATKTPDQILTSLTPAQLAVMQAMPDDRPVTADSLVGLGFAYGDIIAALTMLEILGLIKKLPGALYTKA